MDVFKGLWVTMKVNLGMEDWKDLLAITND